MGTQTDAPTYVLGLERNFRGRELLGQLRSHGIDPTVVYGPDAVTDPNSVVDRYSAEQSRFATGRELAPPEVACALGHMEIYRRLLNSGASWALILEDDVYPIELHRLAQLITLASSSMRGPTVVMLNHDGFLPIPTTSQLLGEGERLDRLDGTPNYTCAYLANRELAQLAVSLQGSHPVDSTADWPFRWRRKVAFWRVHRPLFQHDEAPETSTIRASRASYVASTAWGDRRRLLMALVGTASTFRLIKGIKYGYPPSLLIYEDIIVNVRSWLHRRTTRR